MEFKKITPEMKAMLDEPLPKEALKPHPTKSFLTTIKAIYVTERLNNVFGIGAWKIKTEENQREAGRQEHHGGHEDHLHHP